MTSSQFPIPFVVGLALTRTQLDQLAKHHLGDDFPESANGGDIAYALERYWEDNCIDRTILNLNEVPYRFFCVLDVFPSLNGAPPRLGLTKNGLRMHWFSFGEAWNSVKLLSRRWPRDLPEPKWLYPKMHATMKRMEAAKKE
ncbi:hypothetical protein D9758_010809 [Tetrapyrgos nigripes]|uniref:Uncharacterized protein n=1 Tax=Tetrapyrgos nigripes TaxID=182062 RepID=A0A8H5LQ81_9AGAR|nr:hypothetical protein D9758_010809 [Tetrapyrgos nigripes]